MIVEVIEDALNDNSETDKHIVRLDYAIGVIHFPYSVHVRFFRGLEHMSEVTICNMIINKKIAIYDNYTHKDTQINFVDCVIARHQSSHSTYKNCIGKE